MNKKYTLQISQPSESTIQFDTFLDLENTKYTLKQACKVCKEYGIAATLLDKDGNAKFRINQSGDWSV